MTERGREFAPLYAIPPGDTLDELLAERQMSQSELARRMGRPFKTINEIVQGKAAIMPETAIQLERVLGIPANFWTNLERQYQEDKARVREVEALKEQSAWLERFPLADLRAIGVLPRTRDRATLLHSLLRFFGVASRDAWAKVWLQPQAAFRQSSRTTASLEATAAWLRAGALDAEQVDAASFDRSKFLLFLKQVRSLTRQDPEEFSEPLLEGCRSAGVVVIFLRPFKGVKAYGATQWTSPSKAVIQLSNRYKTDDHLWYSFFHEAGHILLHGARRVFVESREVGEPTSDKAEREADEFAADTLIPKRDWTSFIDMKPSTLGAVVNFADEQGVSPGIVVGRLQHEGIWPHTLGNGLRRKFKLVEAGT